MSGHPSPALKRATKKSQTHPLAGANWGTLIRTLGQNGGVSYDQLWPLMKIVAACLGRLPFTLLERGWVSLAEANYPEPTDPIFILGHWRSGTTHLYNVLSKSPQFGYTPPIATGIPWDMLLIGRLFRPLLERSLPDERFIDNIPVNPDSPQEDEIGLASMQLISFYHGMYFPKAFDLNFEKGVYFEGVTKKEAETWERRFRLFMRKQQSLFPDRQLIIKNPVYTARPKHLLKIYPQAKFINIVRNPYVVFHSMRNFYKKLITQFSLQTGVMIDIDKVILRELPKILNACEEQTSNLPSAQIVNLRYEDLERDPLGQLEKIYHQLALPHYDTSIKIFQNYLRSVKTYQKNRYTFKEADHQLVEQHWQPLLQRLGYSRP